MQTSARLLILVFLMLFLASCRKETIEVSNLQVETPVLQAETPVLQAETPVIQAETPLPQATATISVAGTMEPYIFKSSEPGMVTLRGVLLVLDPYVMLPDPNDAIFFVPLAIEGTGAGTIPTFTIGEVPQADVDERTGEFVFTNIQPGKYAVVVLVQGGSQIPARKYQSDNLAIFTIEEKDIDSTIDLGYLSLP